MTLRFAGSHDVKAKCRVWCDEEIDWLKALIASGASAWRASVALNRSVFQIKRKAREVGAPFPSATGLKTKRRQLFQNVERPRASEAVRSSDET